MIVVHLNIARSDGPAADPRERQDGGEIREKMAVTTVAVNIKV